MTVAFVGVGVQPSRVTASKLADDGSYISSEESKKNPLLSLGFILIIMLMTFQTHGMLSAVDIFPFFQDWLL